MADYATILPHYRISLSRFRVDIDDLNRSSSTTVASNHSSEGRQPTMHLGHLPALKKVSPVSPTSTVFQRSSSNACKSRPSPASTTMLGLKRSMAKSSHRSRGHSFLSKERISPPF
jgi:hypothetical protein